MAQLKVKTRGGSSPQGKQKVYFCCHPADFSVYFQPISEEILAKQNCAIWYDDENHPRDEAFLDNLKEMQLFVMPVTSRLLCSDNPALAVEFAFAIAHHIPVLPLMQEPGLEAAFNEACGNLQFLDKYSADPTVISYDEKLEKHLASVLVGDALAEKVRAAFDAYVFLSYRKKDRKYAQELMRLIHQNDFCRDIAIWYDEFLTPGENWSDAIKAALEKSGLFVLTVTPNMVNEPNYIQQIEYPMAAEQGKPIVPAEMVPTDRGALEGAYTDIPPCADAHNAPALSAALLAAVKTLAIEENDRSPEHNFFIGLAYLSGIDVEVDHLRAVELITGAAEAGLAEAAEKLVEMYRGGVGVEQDFDKALLWMEKQAFIADVAYQQNPTEARLDTLFNRLIDFGTAIFSREFYLQLGRWLYPGEYENYLARAVTAYAQAYTRLLHSPYASTISAQRNLFRYYSAMGDFYQDAAYVPDTNAWDGGQMHLAARYRQQNLELATAWAEELDTVEAWEAVSHAYFALGELIYLRDRQFKAAEEQYLLALRICRAVAAKNGSIEARLLLADTHKTVADFYLHRRQRRKERKHRKEAVDIYEQLTKDTPTQALRENLGVAYNRLAHSLPDTSVSFFSDRVYFSSRKRSRYFKKSYAVFTALMQEYPRVEWYRQWSGPRFGISENPPTKPSV